MSRATLSRVSDRPVHPSNAAANARESGDIAAPVDLLTGTDRRGRISAARHLGELRAVGAVLPLTRCLDAGDDVLRMGALKALGQIGDESAADAVARAGEEDESVLVKCSAASALRALNDDRATPVLVTVLETTTASGHARNWAAKQLVELRAVEAIPALDDAARTASGLTSWRLRRAARPSGVRRWSPGRACLRPSPKQPPADGQTASIRSPQ